MAMIVRDATVTVVNAFAVTVAGGGYSLIMMVVVAVRVVVTVTVVGVQSSTLGGVDVGSTGTSKPGEGASTDVGGSDGGVGLGGGQPGSTGTIKPGCESDAVCSGITVLVRRHDTTGPGKPRGGAISEVGGMEPSMQEGTGLVKLGGGYVRNNGQCLSLAGHGQSLNNYWCS